MRALIKRKIKVISWMIPVTSVCLVCNNTISFAMEGITASLSGNYNVRQEIEHTGHVLVSRPVAADTRIVNIMARNNIKSLKDYAEWLSKSIEYKLDGTIDEWSDPDITLKRGYGDCEDYAFLNARVLKVLGYTPRVLALGDRKKNHAICVFIKDGKYMYFDNSELNEVKVSSLGGFAKYMFSTFKGSVLSEMNLSDRTHNILYVKRV